MDKYYGNVCELDIIFSFTKAYYILDELLLAGELQESSKKNVLRCIAQQDSLEDMEVCRLSPTPLTTTDRAPSLPGRASVDSPLVLTPSPNSLGRGRSHEDHVAEQRVSPVSHRS